MSAEEIKDLLTHTLEGMQVEVDDKAEPKGIKVPPSQIKPVLQELYQNPSTYFDMLSCITGVDNGPEENIMEIIYQL